MSAKMDRTRSAWEAFIAAADIAFEDLRRRDRAIEELRAALRATRYPDGEHRPALTACDGVKDGLGVCACAWPHLNAYLDSVLERSRLADSDDS